MEPHALGHALRTHAGHFLCERINAPGQTRQVAFSHVLTPPVPVDMPPGIGRLAEFYSHFGSVLLYHHEGSGDAARFIAPVEQWSALRAELDDWTAIVGDDEEEPLPEWLDTALVVGEVPASGNYILVPTQGEFAGRVFEFDHDGFEFRDRAPDLFDYVAGLLRPDGSMLTDMASSMRFVEGDPAVQWWILELHDADGLRASTTV